VAAESDGSNVTATQKNTGPINAEVARLAFRHTLTAKHGTKLEPHVAWQHGESEQHVAGDHHAAYYRAAIDLKKFYF